MDPHTLAAVLLPVALTVVPWLGMTLSERLTERKARR